jgi:hypothetical protein
MCHRLEPDNSGANIANLPSLVVFGALVRPQHALMLAAAVVMFGWRGLLVGGILFYVYMANQRQDAAQVQADQGQRMAAVQGYFNQMLGQAPLGRGGSRAGGAPPPPARQAPSDPWAARGRPHKLSDS